MFVLYNDGQMDQLTLNVPEELHLYGLCVYYVVHICDFGTLRVKTTRNKSLDIHAVTIKISMTDYHHLINHQAHG